MLKFSLLGSGSSGNAALIVGERTRVLIDSGLSYKQLCLRAEAVGQSLDGLDAVFITHEHSDHVNGLGVLARKTGVPVFITTPTHRALPPNVGEIPRIEYFEAGDTISVGEFEVCSFSVSHDACDPVCYSIRGRGAKLGFATDLGHCCHLVRARLEGSHALVLESNYCPDRLRLGHYPASVQQRIRSRQGHLSNHDAGALLKSLLHAALRTIVLVHISENNNTPELVKRNALGAVGNHPANIFLATQDAPTPLFEVAP